MHHLFLFFAQNINVNLPNTSGADSGGVIKTIINLFLSIAGAVALLVMTMAGFRYITSRGTPGQVSQSKDAILYSLIGLVVIMSAFVIVNFVVFKLK